jgi:hypothetical protein
MRRREMLVFVAGIPFFLNQSMKEAEACGRRRRKYCCPQPAPMMCAPAAVSTVCPKYPYAFHGSFCSYYAITCQTNIPGSLDASCGIPMTNCPSDPNCVTINTIMLNARNSGVGVGNGRTVASNILNNGLGYYGRVNITTVPGMPADASNALKHEYWFEKNGRFFVTVEFTHTPPAAYGGDAAKFDTELTVEVAARPADVADQASMPGPPIQAHGRHDSVRVFYNRVPRLLLRYKYA